MSKVAKAAIGLGTTAVVMLLAAVLFISNMINRSLPEYSGTFTGAPVKGSIEIYRDSLAIPTIFADDRNDAAFAIGFLHAQERLFQMDLARRIAEGRLSEVIGIEALNFDIMFRVLGMQRIAENGMKSMDPRSMDLLEAYADGVNFYLTQPNTALPVEFAVLGYTPEPWKPLHSVEMTKLMAWQMSSHWFIKMAYIQLQERLGTSIGEILLTKKGEIPSHISVRYEETEVDDEENGEENIEAEENIPRQTETTEGDEQDKSDTKEEEITPDTSREPAVEDTLQPPVQTLPDTKTEDDVPQSPEVPDTSERVSVFQTAEFDWLSEYRDFLTRFHLEGSLKGSNNWVVSGSRSKSGKPLIASDPHLPFITPNIWYAAVIRSEEWNAAGLTLPGLPLVVIGKNDKIAWTLTNGHLDDVDFYRERLDSAKKNYLFGDEWKSLTLIKDTIGILDEPSVPIVIRQTHRGPVITGSHLFNVLYEESFRRSDEISLRWTGAEPGDDIMAYYLLNTAEDWDDFSDALSGYTAPSQNFVYADSEGNIGYIYAGRIPLRPVDDPPLLFDGTQAASDWTGFLPYGQHPKKYNPGEGYIGTANNRPDGYEDYLARFWSPPSRIDRIRELLDSREKHSVQDFQQYQLDQVSPYAQSVVPLLLNAFDNITIKDPNLKKSLELLQTWQCNISPYLQVSAIYEVFLTHLMKNTFTDEMGEDLFGAFSFIRQAPYLTLLRLLEYGNADFFDNVNTTERETRDDILRQSMVDALIELENTAGENLEEWMWGEMHPLTIRHPFSGVSTIVDELVNIGDFGVGGDGTTLYNTEYSFSNETAINGGEQYGVVLGPSMRFIYDFSTPGYFYLVLSSGQSGHIFSDNYDNMTPLYLRGDYVKVHTGNRIRNEQKDLIRISRY